LEQVDEEEVIEFLVTAVNKPQEILQIMKDNDIVIDNLRDKMQKMVFTIYTELVGLSSRAEGLLPEEDTDGTS